MRTFAALGFAGALVSCAVPRAKVVEQPRAPVVAAKQPESVIAAPPLPAMPDDGIRMPEMLDLPSDGDFRSTHPGASQAATGTGAVIARPPTDPPSRVKPKAAAPEPAE